MKRVLPPSLLLRGLLLLVLLAWRSATPAFGQFELEPETGSPTYIAISGPTSVCMGQAATFYAYASGGSCSWGWDEVGGNRLSEAPDGSTVTIAWSSSGFKRIWLYAGCLDDIGGRYSYPQAYLDVYVGASPSPQVITIHSYSNNNPPVNITATSATTCPQAWLRLAPPSGATNCVWSTAGGTPVASDSDGRLFVSGEQGSYEYRLTYRLPNAGPCPLPPLAFTVNVGVQPYWPEPTNLGRYGPGKVVFTLQKYDPTFVYTWYEQETGPTRAPFVDLGGGRFETPTIAASRSYYLSVTTCRESSRQPHPVLLRNVRITVDGQAPTRPVALRYGPGLPLQAEQVDPAYPGPYTWLLNGTVVPNATTARLTVFQAGTYVVRITGSNGAAHDSNPVEVVDALAGQTVNDQPLTYANEIVVLKPGVTTADEVLRLLPAERRQTVTYANGLGRPIQQVGVQAGPLQEDLVQHFGYEGTGTTALTYLPVPVATLAKANGEYEADPLTKLNSYYAAKGGLPSSTTTTEASPLGRPLEQTQTGQAWAGRTSRVSYAGNAASEVRRWQGLDGRQWYPEGQLSKEVALDPDNRRTEVFKDQLGRVVLQRKVADGQHFDTYTVYADAGYVQAIIPPAAVREMAGSGQWNIVDTGFKNRWLYLYTYDDRGRVVERQFPGAAPVYVVYDAFDRPILVQDGNRRASANKQWLFTKFDAQNRSVVEGLWQDASGRSRAEVQDAADAFAQTQTVEYETRTASGYTTGNTFPAVQDGVGGAVLLAASFYDDYDLDGNGTADFSLRAEPQLLPAEQPTATTQTRGMTTVTRRRVVQPGGQYGGWLTTVFFYDQYGNVVQKQGNNLLQPSADLRDVTTLVYREGGFVAQLLRTVKKQEYGATTPVVVRNRFAYDPAGRLLHTWQQHAWKNTVEPEVLVSSNRYTGLGELTQKKLHSRDQGAKFLQYEDFAYNQHGQLTSINNGSLKNNSENDLFGFALYREQAGPGSLGNTPRYDGGISAVSWMVHNSAAPQNPAERERSYRFAYDGLGRLTAATHAARVNPWEFWTLEQGAYDEKNIVYDANGNIMLLERYTQDNTTAAPALLDRLQFGYDGNRPTWADDNADVNRGFKERFAYVEYDYDANGSVTRDVNKNTSYVYNALNKTERQTVGTSNLAFTYDASGAVVRKETTTATIKNEYYVDGFVYEDSPSFTGLRSVPTPEGRALAVQQADTKLTYEYHLRDHLGNLRVAFRAQAGTEELRLSSETSEAEGDYPKFNNIALTRTPSSSAYHESQVAAVTRAAPGPFINVPVAHGDHLQVRVFCKTPNGVQNNATQTPSALRVAPQVSLALAPTFLPSGRTPAPDGRPSTQFTPGLQLNVTGLLSALTAKRLLIPEATSSQIGAATSSLEAKLAWTLYDAKGQVVRSGHVPVPVHADGLWHSLDLSLDIDLSSEDARTGSLRLQELNEASLPVYFDLLTITHPQDQALVSQENHYYPFGMALTGVAVNTTAQPQVSKNQYNGGSELQDELLGADNGIYSTFYRNYDPTIGRFQGIDPMAIKYAGDSPYSFSFNDPTNFNDPYGDDPAIVRNGNTWTISVDHLGAAGGGWSSANGGTYTSYRTDDQAFAVGANYLDRFGAWGQNGFATSRESATYNLEVLQTLNTLTASTQGGFGSFIQNNPSLFVSLWQAYPKNFTDAKGNVIHQRPSMNPLYENQCAIRLSVALMGAGFDMSSFSKLKDPTKNERNPVSAEGWALRAFGLATWLSRDEVLGAPTKVSPDDFHSIYNVKGSGFRGIFFESDPTGISHIDLFWNERSGSGVYAGKEYWIWLIK
ncbi:T6SS effector amidase Tae4 family protein [Hymenobacter arizonensis]|uniref:RHS repeat-associated core domain-containing protein n=1 Tax=Hymenobacter arizonensis TaxID=1227077 RepID=A0A1I6BF87_HYMAR|nr:T6SS effector amidase Tae4 family protein [Hymenobacter arizonensis]SFQ79447.1 RHS repeat-associated core domain-containing protein [Hymenobacter arizonensis]